MSRHWIQTVLCAASLLLSVSGQAKPTGPRVFCDTYPDSGLCAGTLVTCSLCHTSTSPTNVQWNQYGLAILTRRTWETPFEDDLTDVLYAIEQEDTDGDTLDNISEILLGSQPGDWAKEETQPGGRRHPAYGAGMGMLSAQACTCPR